ncbi:DUF1090 domain-containing protein [Variovorax sp. GT1P44]|uniref:DUF1090 domain-containing protein n=1 Tax=Variovorax sp. GT1P44 TaxID=3443742 RepID=UPI003F479C2C
MKLPTILLTVALVSASHGAFAQPGPGGTCRAKHEAISRDIDEAKAQGQTQRLRGLQRALKEVDTNCSDAKLQAEHQKRVDRQEKKVALRERELKEAQQQGNPEKIARRQGKLAQEQAELQRLKEARLN